ncbi:acetylesterase [Clostridia bacterium]|nr:acetylesterase [Clostridia bacterium]
MKHIEIPLRTDRPHVKLVTYLTEPSREMSDTPRPAVIVFPGGGYEFTSDREAEPVAKQFFAAGMQSIVVRYSVSKEAKGLIPATDAALAVKYVRSHAAEWGINPKRIYVCGFSAGGHLAASIGTLYRLPVLQKNTADILGEAITAEDIRPDGMILGYPVISAGVHAHRGSIARLSERADYSEEDINMWSLERQVTSDTPPAFIWHTADDNGVPVENALLFAGALSAAGVPFELHVYPHGPHGLSLATSEVSWDANGIRPNVAEWVKLAIAWVWSLCGE